MLGVGIILTIAFACLWVGVRHRIRSGYVYMAILTCMALPSLLMIKEAVLPWYGDRPACYLYVAVLAMLLCLGFIPWVITDTAFCGAGQRFEINQRYIKVIRITFLALIILSFYSIAYLSPFAYKSVMIGAAQRRVDVWQLRILPPSIFTTIACGGAACFIFCIPAFFISMLDKQLAGFRWWLLTASFSYPVNCLVYTSREGAVVYIAYLLTIAIIFTPMLLQRHRKESLMATGIVTGMLLIGGVTFTVQRFNDPGQSVSALAGSVGYAAQQPYVFSAAIEDEDDFFGINLCLPAVSKALNLDDREYTDLKWNYERMFSTMYGQFYIVGGWWSLAVFSLLYIGWYGGMAAYFLYKRRYSALLLLFISYLFIQLCGDFYFKPGYSPSANIFYIVTAILPLFCPEWLCLKKRDGKTPRLLEINTAVTRCSTGTIASSIIDTADEMGWATAFAYGRNPLPREQRKTSPTSYWKIGDSLSVKFHGLVTRLFDAHGFASRGATLALCRKIRFWQPDIIHLHNIHGYYLNYKILFKELKKMNIPVVWTLHDCWPITGHCAHFTDADCEHWLSGCRVDTCPNSKRYPGAFFNAHPQRNLKSKQQALSGLEKLTVVCVSQWQKSVIARSFLNRYPCICIRNGIDIDFFRPEERQPHPFPQLRAQKKRYVFAAASPWTVSKGVHRLQSAAMALPDDYVLVVAGLNKKQSKKFEANPKMHSVAHISKDMMRDALCHADALFNPTYADTFPTINLEAVACGTPIVTSCIGGSPETIDNAIGIVIEPNSDANIGSALKEILENNAHYVKNCRNFAANFFDSKKQFAQYFTLFENILNDRATFR